MSFDFLVFGAGLSGLTCALRLAKAKRRVALVESSPRPGGVILSEHRDGFLLEHGPNSFTSSEAIHTLIDELGLRERALCRPLRNYERFIWKEGRLRRVPTGPPQFVTSDVLTLAEKVRLVRGLFARQEPLETDAELGRYFRELLGDAAVESLLKPFFAGIYAADADHVSFEATFNKLYESTRRHHSLIGAIRGMRAGAKKPRTPRSLVSFPDGLHELPHTLCEHLRSLAVDIRLAEGGNMALRREVDQWAADLPSGTIRAPHVVIATPADAAARLLQHHAPALTDFLNTIPYARLTILHVGLREDQLEDGRNGFGFLSVANQGVRALGMIWSDRIFPNRAPQGHRLLTCFFGGEKDPQANDFTDDQLQQIIREDLKTTMGFRGGDFPLFSVTRWQRALPVFRLGHVHRQRAASSAIPTGIHLIGNYLTGVSIPDRVEAAMNLAAHLTAGGAPAG